MFKLGKENIDKVYLGKSPVQKMYLGKTLIFPNEEAAECYAITPSIAQYDGDYPWVWAEDTEKWYRLNNYNEYEEYGIYADSIEPYERTDTHYVYGANLASVADIPTNPKFVVDGLFTATSGDIYIGTKGTSDSNDLRMFFTGGNLYWDYGSQRLSGSSFSTTVNTAFHLEFGNGFIKGNWGAKDVDMIGDTTTTPTGKYDINLNAFKVASLKVYDGDTLVADYVGKKKEDNTFGLWENISQTYVQNKTLSGLTQTVESGASTYKGKLSIVDGIEYEWNGSRWVEIGETDEYVPFKMQNTGEWITDGTIEGNVVWKSNSNYHKGNSSATDYLIAQMDGPLSFYARSNGEAKYDFLTIYYPDTTTFKSFKNSASTSYTLVTIPNIKMGEKVKLTYAKDGSSDKNEDRAFVYWLEEHIYPKQYEPKEEPENPMVFETIEEMEAYECVYDKAVAMVGDVTYVYTNDNWTPVDYSKAIKYTTTDGKPLSKTVAGSTANVMINGVGYYLFDEAPISLPVNAFQNVTTLKTINLPNSIESLGDHSFQGCTNLSSFNSDVAGEVKITSNIKSVGGTDSQMFGSCKNIKHIIVEEGGITNIPTGFAADCTALTRVDLPSTVISISNAAFRIDSALKEVYMSGVTRIADAPFSGCTNLTTINDADGTLPEGLTSIGASAFTSCSKLAKITLPSALRTIGDNAFNGCSVLGNVTLPEGITTLGLNTFANCNGFTEVILPDSLTTLNRSSFAHCSNVAHIHLGKNFTTYTTYTDYSSVINSPFVGCNAVTSVTVDDDNTTFVKDNGCSITTVSGQIKQAFPNTTYDEYTSIGTCAFLSVNFGTRAVEIPSGVTQIPREAFRNMTAQSITIPDSVVGEMYGWFRDAKIVNYFIGSGITKAFNRVWDTFDTTKTARRIEFTNAANLTGLFGYTSGLNNVNYLRVPHINIDFNISFSTAFTREALLDIIDDLEEPETGAHTLTMGATNLAKLTEEDISKALSNRWILQ